MPVQTSLRHDWCVFGYEVLIQVNLYCSIIAFSVCARVGREVLVIALHYSNGITPKHTSACLRALGRSVGLCQLKQSAGQRESVALLSTCRLQRVIASPIMHRRRTLWSFAHIRTHAQTRWDSVCLAWWHFFPVYVIITEIYSMSNRCFWCSSCLLVKIEWIHLHIPRTNGWENILNCFKDFIKYT